jgi:hypothetical protein
VKASAGQRVGPGPNVFSDSEKNVWVDAEGRLHLRITKRDGKWLAAELVSKRSFGYGRYIFQVDAVKNMSPNVVGGLFTWDNTSATDAHRELDFEYGVWSNPQSPNFQAVVQPFSRKGHIERYRVPLDGPMTHSFLWRPDRIDFLSASGSVENPEAAQALHSWSFTGPDIPHQGNEQARINLWLFRGDPPTGSAEPEIILRKFAFISAQK